MKSTKVLPGRYYYVEGTGWFVCRARTKRQAYSEGAEEYGRGGTFACREATPDELRQFLHQSGRTIESIDEEVQ